MEERSESRKRIKLEKQALERPASNPRLNGCQFFVKRKHRFCKLEKVKKNNKKIDKSYNLIEISKIRT